MKAVLFYSYKVTKITQEVCGDMEMKCQMLLFIKLDFYGNHAMGINDMHI